MVVITKELPSDFFESGERVGLAGEEGGRGF